MSKGWKIAIGVVIAVVVIVGIGLPIAGLAIFRNWGHERSWRLGMVHRWESEADVLPPAASQLEVNLVDDDGDGVPDRGVIEFPTKAALAPGRGMHFGRGFRPGRGIRGRAFGPFLIVGGLVHLALLAVVVFLSIALYRHWRKAQPVSASSQPGE